MIYLSIVLIKDVQTLFKNNHISDNNNTSKYGNMINQSSISFQQILSKQEILINLTINDIILQVIRSIFFDQKIIFLYLYRYILEMSYSTYQSNYSLGASSYLSNQIVCELFKTIQAILEGKQGQLATNTKNIHPSVLKEYEAVKNIAMDLSKKQYYQDKSSQESASNQIKNLNSKLQQVMAQNQKQYQTTDTQTTDNEMDCLRKQNSVLKERLGSIECQLARIMMVSRNSMQQKEMLQSHMMRLEKRLAQSQINYKRLQDQKMYLSCELENIKCELEAKNRGGDIENQQKRENQELKQSKMKIEENYMRVISESKDELAKLKQMQYICEDKNKNLQKALKQHQIMNEQLIMHIRDLQHAIVDIRQQSTNKNEVSSPLEANKQNNQREKLQKQQNQMLHCKLNEVQQRCKELNHKLNDERSQNQYMRVKIQQTQRQLDQIRCQNQSLNLHISQIMISKAKNNGEDEKRKYQDQIKNLQGINEDKNAHLEKMERKVKELSCEIEEIRRASFENSMKKEAKGSNESKSQSQLCQVIVKLEKHQRDLLKENQILKQQINKLSVEGSAQKQKKENFNLQMKIDNLMKENEELKAKMQDLFMKVKRYEKEMGEIKENPKKENNDIAAMKEARQLEKIQKLEINRKDLILEIEEYKMEIKEKDEQIEQMKKKLIEKK